MAKGIKTGGREVGTPNKTTAEMREFINQFISSNWQSVQSDFDKLEPKERLQFFERLMQYAIPKMQSISHDFEIEAKLNSMSETEIDTIIERLSETIGIPQQKTRLPEWMRSTPKGSTA